MSPVYKIEFQNLGIGDFFYFKGFIWKKVDKNFIAMPACFQTGRDDIITKMPLKDDEIVSAFVNA